MTSIEEHTPRFDAFPERYDAYNAVRDRLAPATADWVRAHLPGGQRAADLGCGPGRFTPMLADRYDEVLAVDVSDQLLRLARQRRARPNISYQRRSLLELAPDRDGAFDAVLTVNALHHVGPLETVLPQVRRLVAPGGWLLLVDIVDPGGLGDAGGWGDWQWHVDRAFAAARAFYDLGDGDPDAAADVLRLLAHPQWIEMSIAESPPTRTEYRGHAEAALPGASYTDDLHPLGIQTALAWQAPPG